MANHPTYLPEHHIQNCSNDPMNRNPMYKTRESWSNTCLMLSAPGSWFWKRIHKYGSCRWWTWNSGWRLFEWHLQQAPHLHQFYSFIQTLETHRNKGTCSKDDFWVQINAFVQSTINPRFTRNLSIGNDVVLNSGQCRVENEKCLVQYGLGWWWWIYGMEDKMRAMMGMSEHATWGDEEGRL